MLVVLFDARVTKVTAIRNTDCF